MKRVLKFFAILLGTFFTAGVISCSSSDSDECCTYSYVYEGATYLYEFCPDGTYTYSYNGEVQFSGSWEGETTWEEIQSYCE